MLSHPLQPQRWGVCELRPSIVCYLVVLLEKKLESDLLNLVLSALHIRDETRKNTEEEEAAETAEAATEEPAETAETEKKLESVENYHCCRASTVHQEAI